VRLISRNGIDHARRYPDVAAAIARLPAPTLVLDGELAVFDAQLRSRFDWLRHRQPAKLATPPVLIVFDLMYVKGRDVSRRPLRERRARLEDLVGDGDMIHAARRLAPHGLKAWAQVRDLVSIDFFTVPTARLRVLFVLVVLAHHRRRVVHFNVTEHPTAAWTAQQVVDTFPDDSAPSYLLRDRDSIYGHVLRQRLKRMGVGEVLTAPHSPWQNPFAERLIGSIRRECLDHVLVLGESHLRRILTRYFAYYHRARTHLSLDKDAPNGRPIERTALGRVISIREVGGLHHRYVRRAA